MEKPDCEYFIRKSKNKNSITGYFDENLVICDNYDCVANGGRFFSTDLAREIGFCDVQGLASELERLSVSK